MGALDHFETYVAICDAGSISAAAKVLDTPRATVSRHLAKLERDLGVRLLHRSSRRLDRTAAGDELYRRARRVVDDAHAARDAVRVLDDTPRGLIRMSVPGDMNNLLGPLLLTFLDRYPHVQIELVVTTRFVDLAAEGFDLALRAGRLESPNLIARQLRRLDIRAYASETYIARHGLPETLEALADHTCLRAFDRGSVPQTHWPLLSGGTVPIQGRFSTNHLPMLTRAVHQGRGIGLLPWAPPGCRPVLPEVIGTRSSVSIVYPERTLLPAKVRALIEHIVTELERIPFTSPSEWPQILEA